MWSTGWTNLRVSLSAKPSLSMTLFHGNDGEVGGVKGAAQFLPDASDGSGDDDGGFFHGGELGAEIGRFEVFGDAFFGIDIQSL